MRGRAINEQNGTAHLPVAKGDSTSLAPAYLCARSRNGTKSECVQNLANKTSVAKLGHTQEGEFVTGHLTPSPRPRSYQGETHFPESQVNVSFTVHATRHVMLEDNWERLKLNTSQEARNQAEFLAAGEACKACVLAWVP